MILLVNSATSNVGSWINILKNLDQKYVLSDNQYWNENEIKKIIFPGIGNFYKVSNDILKKNLREKLIYLINNNISYLGICIGMQILFENSDEDKGSFKNQGLGLLKGKVCKINEKNFLIPHNGWNNIYIKKKNSLFSSIQSGNDFYFNHSYYCKCHDENDVTSFLQDNPEITTSIQKRNIYGVQFHPEKSLKIGFQLIKNFLES